QEATRSRASRRLPPSHGPRGRRGARGRRPASHRAPLAPSRRPARGGLPSPLRGSLVLRDRNDHGRSHVHRREPLPPRHPPAAASHRGKEMKDDRDSVGRLLRDLRPPTVPSELRDRTLAGARRALEQEGTHSPVDVWTSLWESRPLRLAWGFSVASLL